MKVTARAKINLTLHVGRVIEDPHDAFFGYHPIDSLVAFADIGDIIGMQSATETVLKISGPFAKGLTAADDNLILRAASAAKVPPHTITLEKHLPVAAGIGGGSANAAAILRFCSIDDPTIAIGLGADVPVCLLSKTAHMTGIGEDVRPLPNLGTLYAVLVNPGVAVSTAAIFKAFDSVHDIRETPRPMKPEGDLLSRALDGRNDLESVALSQAPIIGQVLRSLSAQEGCQLARMSGSGATCFGVYESLSAAQKAQSVIKAQMPNWWCVATILGD